MEEEYQLKSTQISKNQESIIYIYIYININIYKYIYFGFLTKTTITGHYTVSWINSNLQMAAYYLVFLSDCDCLLSQ